MQKAFVPPLRLKTEEVYACPVKDNKAGLVIFKPIRVVPRNIRPIYLGRFFILSRLLKWRWFYAYQQDVFFDS